MIQKIGQYSIVEKLSEGQQGILYKAYDNAQSRPVALRTVAPDLASDAVSEENLYRACQSAAKLRHPNIIEIYAVGKEAGVTYVAMELLEGNDLRSLITEHSAIPLEAKLSVMIQIADALHYAHNNGVPHHNLSPSKVHIIPAGIIKVRGFGSPALFLPRPDHAEPCSEVPLYSAPEQILGGESGIKADIFAAGMLFYELLTYTYPFSDPQSGNARERILSQTEIATVDKYPDLPLGCWPIIEKCLEKDP